MKEFKKYQHVERFGTSSVSKIDIGKCYIFYKIDGSNGSVWLSDNKIRAGSRRRELTLENDRSGFLQYVLQNKNIANYLAKYPAHRLYGEWLIPHTLKTYKENAWRKFYVFDVCTDKEDGSLEYISYDIYKPALEEFGIEYIPVLGILTNPSYQSLLKFVEKSGQFLIEDGKGLGEGIIIKNYDFYNRSNRQVWAKIVADEFRERMDNKKAKNNMRSDQMIEEKIVNDFCTSAFIEKEYAKIINEKQGWKSEYIPMLFGRIFSELIKEESWNIIKKYKYPEINFKTLNALVIQNIKSVKKDIFTEGSF